MKRVRCPKCDNYITFDETRYEEGQSLVFQCPDCGKQFGIRMPARANVRAPHEEPLRGTGPLRPSASALEPAPATLVVIENRFHYKQELPLKMGDNIIGRYMKGSRATIPIETSDPSMDICHCLINLSRDKKGRLRVSLSDGPSNTGTFVGNDILGDKERRLLADGDLFTIGATSIILRLATIS